MNLIGLMLAALGAFALSGAVFNWDFFMDSKKGARMSKFMGRNGARVFYGLIGLAILSRP
jgi:hypothetical protein